MDVIISFFGLLPVSAYFEMRDKPGRIKLHRDSHLLGHAKVIGIIFSFFF